jgi:hypothetical protein
MTDRSKPVASAKSAGASQSMPIIGEVIMKSMLLSACAILMMSGISMAKELPDAPSTVEASGAFFVEVQSPSTSAPAPKFVEKQRIDATFLSLAVISTGSTFADSFTTLFARQNWLAGKKGVCNMEVQSAYLYGTHPTVGRAYAVASVKSASSVFAAYYLRKHHNKFWSMPLIANSVVSLQGVTQNMMACN